MTTPRYQCVSFPGLGVILEAVPDDQCQPVQIAGLGKPGTSHWTLCDCREYARSSGFTVEEGGRIEDGLYQTTWTLPVELPAAA